MKILMVDNTASVGWNLKKGLEKNGHSCTLVCDRHSVHSAVPDVLLSDVEFLTDEFSDDYDIVHIHCPSTKKIIKFFRYVTKTPLVCHWHGTGLRKIKSYYPTKYLCNKYAKAHLYSTMDLKWFLNLFFTNKNTHLFRCPIDTDLFKILNQGKRKERIVFDNNNKRYIEHDKMPELYNEYENVRIIHNADSHMVTVTAMEAVCCGCVVEDLEYLDMDWIFKNATIECQTKKLLEIYNGILNE